MSKPETPLLARSHDSQLVVIDVQTRLAKVMSERKTLLGNCEILIRSAGLLEIPVTITEQYPKGIGKTESSLVEALGEGYQPVEKTCFSCYQSSEFQSLIQKQSRGQIVLCGIESHICVLQTAMDLLNNHKQVFIVADAVDSRNRKNKRIALKRLQQAGAIITCTESVLFEWLSDASHAHFKTISAMIR